MQAAPWPAKRGARGRKADGRRQAAARNDRLPASLVHASSRLSLLLNDARRSAVWECLPPDLQRSRNGFERLCGPARVQTASAVVDGVSDFV